jgi:large subunit ribosomal protein L30
MTTARKDETKKPAAAALEEIEKTVGLRPRKPRAEAAPRPAGKAEPKASMIRIRQVRSGICAPVDQKLTLRGLGLRRINQEVVRPDNPSIRGMARKVRHLVEVRPAGQ